MIDEATLRKKIERIITGWGGNIPDYMMDQIMMAIEIEHEGKIEISANRISEAEDRLLTLKNEYLRKRAWEFRTELGPWLWVKEIEGVMVCVEQNTAIYLEERLEATDISEDSNGKSD